MIKETVWAKWGQNFLDKAAFESSYPLRFSKIFVLSMHLKTVSIENISLSRNKKNKKKYFRPIVSW